MAASLNVTSSNLTVQRTCVVTGFPNSTTRVIDAFVKQESPTQTTNGGANTMDVQSSAAGSGSNHRSFVRFDLSGCSIPTTATVKTVTLSLYVVTLANNCRTHDIQKATSTWSETVSWNTMPTVSGTVSSQQNVGNVTGCANKTTNTYVNWTGSTAGAGLVADAQSWVTTPANNFGWMVRDDVESSATAYKFTYQTHEINTLAKSPQLTVGFVTS
jgi:hypothetical protein